MVNSVKYRIITPWKEGLCVREEKHQVLSLSSAGLTSPTNQSYQAVSASSFMHNSPRTIMLIDSRNNI